MKKLMVLLFVGLISFGGLSLTGCGGEEEKKEEPAKKTEGETETLAAE